MQNSSDERNEKQEMTQEELDRFHDFFTTSVAQVPEEMIRREQDKNKKISGGLFQRLFGKKSGGEEAEGGAAGELTIPTGEVLLDGRDETGEVVLEPVVPEEPEALPLSAPEPDDLFAAELLPDAELPAGEGSAAEEDPPARKTEEMPRPEAPCGPEPVGQMPDPQPAPAQQNRPKAQKAARRPVPEDKGLRELKELLDAMQAGRPLNLETAAAPVEAAGAPPAEPAEELPPTPPQQAKPETKAEPDRAQAPLGLVFAEAKKAEEIEKTEEAEKTEETPAVPLPDVPDPDETAAPPQPEAAEPTQRELSKKERWERLFQMFGAGEDELPPEGQRAAQAPDRPKEDTLSLPLIGVEEEASPAEPAPEAAEPSPAAEGQQDGQPAAGEDEPEEPQSAEEIGENLKHMAARLTLRCVLSGILAGALLLLGLMEEGLLPPTEALDPVGAPVAFMGANLLLLLVAVGVSFGTVREGLAGLFGQPSADCLPAAAAAAAAVQAVTALLNAESYRPAGLTLMSGMAALLLFMAALGDRIQLASVQGNYELISCGVEHSGAYRARDRDLVHCLAEGMEEKDPWILLSRPMEWNSNFIEQSFSGRSSEQTARRMARILLAGGVLSGIVTSIMGKGAAGAASALATVVCLGAPLSVTLIAGLTSLRMQRTAGTVGAVIPGWAAVEELGGIDTVQVDARDLFTPECAQLEDLRIFKGGRIDRAILYTASVLSEGCNTLSGLFRQIIADRTDILLPVKDLEKRRGLGFAAWCDNCRVLVGTRGMMEQEGVPLPEQEYEDQHSRSGELQVLYLAVSGELHAMFVLKYVGGRHAARGLAALQRENIHLLVACDDPTLTAQRINEVYRLPEGMVRVMTEEQCRMLAPAVAYTSDVPCCMVHLKGFASLTGGLRAASRAQTAEQAGTTVQLVSVCISVAIGLLLTYAGSVGTLSLAAVLMYQAAWSALSIALAVMRQH